MSKDAVTTATERNHLAKKWTSGLTTKQYKQKTNHLETTIDTGGDKQARYRCNTSMRDRNLEVHSSFVLQSETVSLSYRPCQKEIVYKKSISLLYKIM